VREGVLVTSGGDVPVDEVLVMFRSISGDVLSGSVVVSAGAPGIGMGSDISNIVRLWALEEETPKDTLRSKLLPRRTRPSAMIFYRFSKIRGGKRSYIDDR
jgi:hypothetical protein